MSEKQSQTRQTRRSFLTTLATTAGLAATLPFVFKTKTVRNLFSPRSAPRLLQGQRQMMGTWVSITVFSHDEAQAQRAIHAALDAMAQIDRLMSVHRADSQLSQLNARAGDRLMTIDGRLLEVLQMATGICQASNGAYDVTLLPLMRLFGFYGNTRSRIPGDREIAAVLESTGSRYLIVESANSRAGLTQTGAAIDLGSIGKGYAVDCARRVLSSYGIRAALIDAGGNLFAMGAPYEDEDPRAGWRVGIRNPTGESSVFATLLLRDQAIATSGNTNNTLRYDSVEIGHILDMRTGRPSQAYVSCTALAPTAMEADALSTAGYVLGKTQAQQTFSNRDFYFYT